MFPSVIAIAWFTFHFNRQHNCVIKKKCNISSLEFLGILCVQQVLATMLARYSNNHTTTHHNNRNIYNKAKYRPMLTILSRP